MEYITLANSDIKVSRLCMGGCPMGGHGWGNVQRDNLIKAVHTAIDCGINFFDTADTYGLGAAERTLAEAIGEKRKDIIIESKFGVRFSPEGTKIDNSASYIKNAVEESLKRLKTDYIDIYVIHYRDYITPISEVMECLFSLRKEGKIRYFGLSNISVEGIPELLPYKDEFVCCQDEFSLACRKYEEALIEMQFLMHTTPFSWGSLGQGILTGKYDKNCHFDFDDRRSRDIYINFHGEKLLKNLRIVEKLKVIAQKHNVTPAAVAIRFILDYLKNSVALVGAKSPSQILGNVASIGWQLSSEEIDELNSISK